jgi:hypothetical protein
MATKRPTGNATTKRASARARISAYRRRMRAMGYRPMEVWVPDTKSPRFAATFRRQCRLVAARERSDASVDAWLDANAADMLVEIERAEQASGSPQPAWGPESPV